MRKILSAGLLVMLVMFGGWRCAGEEAVAPAGVAAEVKGAQPGDAKQENVQLDKQQLAKLRGKLLYKRGQVRKLEKGAIAADAELAEKLNELEAKRRALLVAAEPRLGALYAEQDKLAEEVQAASGK